MTNDEALQLLFVDDWETAPPLSRTYTPYQSRLAKIAASGLKRVFVHNQQEWADLIAHPQLRDYTFNRVGHTPDAVMVELFGVTLCCLTGGK